MSENDSHRKKILLVEDDTAITDIYTTILQKHGFEVVAVSYGAEAIQKVKEATTKQEGVPDIVLLDLILPDMHGREVLREIRHNEASKNIKVFVLTNQQDAELEKSDGELRPDKFLIKANTTTAELLEHIKKALT